MNHFCACRFRTGEVETFEQEKTSVVELGISYASSFVLTVEIGVENTAPSVQYKVSATREKRFSSSPVKQLL